MPGTVLDTGDLLIKKNSILDLLELQFLSFWNYMWIGHNLIFYLSKKITVSDEPMGLC